MRECWYFSRSPEKLVEKQFIFLNLLNFWGKQMQLAQVLWFKIYKRYWPNFAAFVAKAQTRVATLMFGLIHACRNTDLPCGE